MHLEHHLLRHLNSCSHSRELNIGIIFFTFFFNKFRLNFIFVYIFKDVLHFFLRGPGNTGRWCHTRLRPRTKLFLESASKNFELHVCTFGARQYAHAVAELLDPEKKYFSHRILSRDECFDARTKAANLK